MFSARAASLTVFHICIIALLASSSHISLRAATPINRDAVFVEAPVYSSGGTDTSSVAVADLNGDGHPDLVIGNWCAAGTTNCDATSSLGSVSVLLAKGNGTFERPLNYSTGGHGTQAIAIADLNGDGKPDLVVANWCAAGSNCSSTGAVTVLLGNGDGTFQSPTSFSSGGELAWSVAVADLNGDGKPDLIVANQCASGSANYCGGSFPGIVAVLLGKGDGTFQPPVSYSSGGTIAMSVAVADVNGDGHPDVVVAHHSSSTVTVLLGNGDGTLKLPVSYGSGGQDASSVALADLNGDGKLDIVVANYCPVNTSCTGVYTGIVGVLFGNGDGTFQSAVIYSSGGGYATALMIVDVNADGKPDIVVANPTMIGNNNRTGAVGVLLNNGNGTFQSPLSFADGLSAGSIAIEDLNGDGIPDLAVAGSDPANSAAGAVAVLFGRGNGTFQAAPVFQSAEGFLTNPHPDTAAIAMGNLTGNGNLDLVIGNWCPGSDTTCSSTGSVSTISVLMGNGDGTFQPAVKYDSGGVHVTSVAIADVNGDGKSDLVVSNKCSDRFCSSDGLISVFLGNGDGTFQPAMNFDSGAGNATSVKVVDLNADGKPDLVVGNRCLAFTGCVELDSIGVLLGNGDGTFQPPVMYNTGGTSATSIALADLNADGKADLVVGNDCLGNSNCNFVLASVLLGNGDGTFQAPITYGSDYGISVAVGDFNDDGKLDLLAATANGSISDVMSVLGQGNGIFSGGSSVSTQGLICCYESVALADYNGDGRLDVAVSEGWGNGGFLGVVLLGNGDGSFQSPMYLGVGGLAVAAGDFNHDGKPDLAVANEAGVSILVHRRSTTTKLVSSPNPSLATQTVTFTITVSPQLQAIPAGPVTLIKGTSILATLPLTNGEATYTTSSLPVGSWPMTAVYGGDPTFFGSTSPTVNQVVKKVPTAIALVSSLNPSSYGQSVTFTATLSSTLGTPPNGQTVTFKDGSTVLGTGTLLSGAATFSTAGLAAGTHSITATYGGDTSYAASTSAKLSQVVNGLPTITMIASNLNPSVYGQTVTFKATVAAQSGTGPTPTGTLTFKSGTTVLAKGLALTGGVASYTTTGTMLTAGTKSITAVYSGDTTYSTSTSTVLSQVVNKATTTTTITSSINPSTFGQSVTFTATVAPEFSGTATGSVTFKLGITNLATVTLSSGKASYTTSTLPAGSDVITGKYGGSVNFNLSSVTVTQVVNP